MTDSDNANHDDLVDVGLDSVGAVAGTAIGLAVAGPAGAFLGAAVGPFVPMILQRTASEFQRHVLGQREEKRIASVLELAVQRIRYNVEQGLEVRQDDFFQLGQDNRAVAEEILEGVLIAAQREHEEKKLKYYANLFANIAFRDDIDRDLANAILSVVQGWSYRQIVILSVFANTDHCRPRFRFGEEQNVNRLSIGGDVYSMGQQGVLILEDNTTYSVDIEIYGATEFGKMITELMDVSDLEDSVIDGLTDILAQDIGPWIERMKNQIVKSQNTH